jgi:hypothetical protein
MGEGEEVSDTNGFNGNFTPTQRRFLALLCDGEMHHIDLFIPLLNDDQPSEGRKSIYWHVQALNKRLQRQGQKVVLERQYRKTYLRQVRLLRSPARD